MLSSDWLIKGAFFTNSLFFFSLSPHRSDIFPCEFRIAWYLPKHGTGQIPHLRESPFLK